MKDLNIDGRLLDDQRRWERPECTDLFDPRHALVDGWPHYGAARTIADLAGTWAEGLDYDQKICRVWNLGV